MKRHSESLAKEIALLKIAITEGRKKLYKDNSSITLQVALFRHGSP